MNKLLWFDPNADSIIGNYKKSNGKPYAHKTIRDMIEKL